MGSNEIKVPSFLNMIDVLFWTMWVSSDQRSGIASAHIRTKYHVDLHLYGIKVSGTGYCWAFSEHAENTKIERLKEPQDKQARNLENKSENHMVTNKT